MIPTELESSITAAEEKVLRGLNMFNWLDNYCQEPFLCSTMCFSLQGMVPFYVNATAGTTVYGAFDPFSVIADICHRRNLWMHVDVRFLSICIYKSCDVNIIACHMLNTGVL